MPLPTLSLVTPTYRPDLELCRDLRATVRRYAPPGTDHLLVVPAADREAFAAFAGDGCRVAVVGDLLPRNFVPVPRVNAWVNLRRPYPPVRGWIAQQVVKLAAAAAAQTDVVALVDSDLAFVRPFTAADFVAADGHVEFYRAPDAVHDAMPHHVRWHRTARALLGLPADVDPPLHDYIGWPMVWEPRIVRELLDRVEAVAGRPWTTVVASTLHLSEGILYGVYVDEVLGGAPGATDRMPCVGHSDETPMDRPGIEALLATLRPTDVAVMLSAKSGTHLSDRRAALAPHLTGADAGSVGP